VEVNLCNRQAGALIGSDALYDRFQDDRQRKEVKAIARSKFIRGVVNKCFWRQQRVICN
jgi:hypothetical protein